MPTNLEEAQGVHTPGVGENPFNAVWESQPAKPVSDTPIEITVVARRCVYVNDYRVAGSKPYYSENLPSFDHKTKIGEVLDAFTEKQIRAYLKEKKATRDYFAAYHAARAAIQLAEGR